MKTILAVVVLYKTPADSSPAFRALQTTLQQEARFAASVELIVCDNTPYEQPLPTGFTGQYLRDTTNPGLAKRYNQALAIANDRACPWLLLLDQDTTPTPAYFQEILNQTTQNLADPEIVALVPRLVQNGNVQSPHAPPTYRHMPFNPAAKGKQLCRLYAFNSGSVLRTSALTDMGGFPEEFWLDFLDHAVFHRLQQAGGRIFVLQATLSHDLSSNTIAARDEIAQKRYQNILNAEHLFYRRYGTPLERIYHRVRLFRGFLGELIKKRRPQAAWQMLKSALTFSH